MGSGTEVKERMCDLRSSVQRSGKQLQEALRVQRGGHVDLPRSDARQAVAHAASDEPARASSLPLNDVDGLEQVSGEPASQARTRARSAWRFMIPISDSSGWDLQLCVDAQCAVFFCWLVL
jgi:hypothetical protein